MASWTRALRFVVSLCMFFATYGFLEQYQDVFKNAEFILNGVGHGLKVLSRGARTVEGILDEATEEYCVFRCPNGVKPKKNRYHTPRANGCGSHGVQLPDDQLPVAELKPCCDKHDYCYDSCNNPKEECDVKFRRCLYDICEKYKPKISNDVYIGCKAAAKGMYTGTLALGCRAYKDAQSEACYCQGANSHREL